MCACRSKCTYWMGATAPQRCELFVNYFAVYLTGRSSNIPPEAVMTAGRDVRFFAYVM